MVRSWLSLSLLAVLLGAQTPLVAHNTEFLPGDAFFHTILTENKVKEIQDQKDPQFGYVRPDQYSEPYLCGYAGYGGLTIVGMSEELRKQLRELYYDIRRGTPKRVRLLGDGDDKQIWWEENGLHVLFYNSDFDFEKHHPFLKYNEDWIKETASFGSPPERVHLERFVPDWEGREWRDSPVVPPLKAKILKKEGDFFDNGSIELQDPVCVIAFTPEDLAKYKNQEDGAKFYLVNGREIVVYEFEHRSWKRRVDENDQPVKPHKDLFSAPDGDKNSDS